MHRESYAVPASLLLLVLFLGVVPLVSSCRPSTTFAQSAGLKIVATTSLVGDVVSQVGGDKISLQVLLPLGTDPHSFTPTPRDASMISDATVVFANGVGLEEFLKPILENIGGASKVVEVSQGIKYRSLIEQDSHSNLPVDDPHTWMDPNNVLVWVDNIVRVLSEIDPANASYFRQNGKDYQARLKELDTWIRSQVDLVSAQDRKLVTDHMVFGYFADRYGFLQVGAIIPGFSSLAQPSAQDIAQIEDEIQSLGVKALFISVGVNANLAQRISDDTGTNLVYLYMHSLSGKDGVADNYIDFMHYDVNSIVDALK